MWEGAIRDAIFLGLVTTSAAHPHAQLVPPIAPMFASCQRFVYDGNNA